MKTLRKATTILVVLLTVSTIGAQTQAETFASFWKTFKAALGRNDKQAVADLTKFPFMFESRDRDRAGFIKIYDQLLPRKIRRCIATAKPAKEYGEEETYHVFCGVYMFYFGKDTDGKYKFLGFAVDSEALFPLVRWGDEHGHEEWEPKSGINHLRLRKASPQPDA